MELVKKSLGKWITAAIILVIGILCIVAGAATNEASADAYKGISVTIGVVFIVVSAIALILGLVTTIMTKNQTTFASTGLAAAATLAAGIFCVVDKTVAGSLILYFISYIPYLLIVAGFIIAIDAIFMLVFSIMNKTIKSALPAICIGCIIAIVAIVLGALSVGNDPVIEKSAQLIVFGIVLIVVAIFSVLTTFVKTPSINLGKKKDSVDAEVKEVPAEEKKAE